METWKIIPSYSYYSASSLGRIKRNAGTPRCPKDRVLKQRMTNYGYLIVSPLRPNTKQRPITVHRLVLEAFCGKIPADKEQGNHLNGIKTDNRIENLEYVSRGENVKHSYDTGLHKHYIGENASASKLTDKDVIDILNELLTENIEKILPIFTEFLPRLLAILFVVTIGLTFLDLICPQAEKVDISFWMPMLSKLRQ